MSANSKIEWCHHTFNGWIGCSKVSPGCAQCYAEHSTRARVLRANGKETWGKGAPRVRTKTWGDPVKWNKAAGIEMRSWHAFCESFGASESECIQAGFYKPVRPRVFCASLSDWLDDEVPVEWLADLLALMHATPNLDWLMLSKRPENWGHRVNYAAAYLLAAGLPAGKWAAQWTTGTPPHNVWIGTTVENQAMADKRIPLLLSIPARVRFLSCEPLLEFTDIQQVGDDDLTIYWPLVGKAISDGMNEPECLSGGGIHWVIAGGESGPLARPMHSVWARALRDQCEMYGVPYFFKQWGEWLPVDQASHLETALPLTKAYKGHKHPDGTLMLRVGKANAGRLLDGRRHDAFPKGGGQ